MKLFKPTQGWMTAVLFALAAMDTAYPVDARDPEHYRMVQTELKASLSHWLPDRIRQLEAERDELLEKISGLPQHDPIPLADHLGYHSEPRHGTVPGGSTNREINIDFEYDPQLGAIALVPAFVPGETGNYAFPKRFKIEIIDRGAGWVGGDDGKWVVPPPPYERYEVVNWMEEDFPDPGPYPVFFFIGGTRVYQLRLTVPQDVEQKDASYYALGEMYLFRQQENGLLGDNMMVWGEDVSVSTSDSMSRPPLWDEAYLYDGISGLGVPLSEETGGAGDFMVSWKAADADAAPVQIVLDLGQTRPIGRVQLWPAKAPHGMAVPQFGFPGRVLVELSKSEDFREMNRFVVEDVRRRMHHDSLLNVITKAYEARYIRLTLEDLGEYKGETILGLGEIRVSEFDEVWSLNCAVSASGIPSSDISQLPLLVDGFSRERSILREVEWIRGLALRRPLDRRLIAVEQELELARYSWGRLKLRVGIWTGGLLFAGLLGAMGLQRLQRRRVLKRLKLRITRDLHDEVGSSLGSITLASRRMEDAGATRADLSELSLMAREASASLRDVVWVTSQDSIRLPELLRKLAERAERVLIGMELAIHLPDECPNHEVPLTFKRHLLMFFKEAVHNCARHSNATEVRVVIAVEHEQLEVSLLDNGCGFDPQEKRDGWGVDSMKKRAREMGGEMLLESTPGAGTGITLKVPLSALLKKSEHSYKTSN